MGKYKKYVLILVLIMITAFAADLYAQCPMCKMAAESNLKNGGTAGKGLNTGILYMLATPYLIVATLGFLWYRNRRLPADQDDLSVE